MRTDKGERGTESQSGKQRGGPPYNARSGERLEQRPSG